MKLEKAITKFVTFVKYYSIFCIGYGFTMIMECGFDWIFIFIICVSILSAYGTSVKLNEDAKDRENDD